jgi:ABC-type phosphate transport system substrate-binding protein
METFVSEDEVKKVKTEKNALGFVALDNAHTEKIKILQVGVMRRDGEALYYDPYVAYLISQTYPLVRTTAIIINDPAIGVASGFASFLTSYEGQKIVSKYNLGPATVPVKMVELNRR